MLFIGTNTGEHRATYRYFCIGKEYCTCTCTLHDAVVVIVGVITLWETKGNKCLMYWTTDLLEVSESMHTL